MNLTVKATTVVEGFASWQDAADFLGKIEKTLMAGLQIIDASISSRTSRFGGRETKTWTVDVATRMTSTLDELMAAGFGGTAT
jgi:hypothetical protein